MLVYVINKQKLISFTLPSKIYGNYWIKDTEEANEKNIINISEYDGKWAAFSNKNVKIIINNEPVRSVLLEEYQFLFLKVKDEPGYLILYTSPVRDDSMVRLLVNGDRDLIVGSDPKSTICCQNELINKTHLKLTYQKKTWLLEDLKSQYGTFINNKKAVGITRLSHGDVIFVMGLKMIVLGNTIIINNPKGSMHYQENFLQRVEEVKRIEQTLDKEEEQEIYLYEEEDYFTRSPRFVEKVEEETLKIESHPNIEEEDETPLLLTIGPMITMGSTSFVMLLVTFISMKQGNRDFLSVMPTLAISISMMAGTLIWPTLNRSFSKKQRKKKIEKINKKYGEYLQKKEQELKQIGNKQRQILLSRNISPIECHNIVANRSKNLWERQLHQEDFLKVRLGLGKVPLKVKLDYPSEHFTLEEDTLDQKMRLIIENNKEIDGTPIVESLVEKNILAITGKYEYIKSYVDILILQMIALHSYDELKIVVLTSKAKSTGWHYMNLLPHAFSDNKDIRFFTNDFDEGRELSSYLQKILKSRQEYAKRANGNKAETYKNFDNYYMIITDDYKTAKEYQIINEILEQEGNLGFSILILTQTIANLPTQTKAFISLDGYEQGGIFENEINKETQKQFTIEKFDQIDLEYCSLRLSNIPIKNKNETFHIPRTLGFLEMYHAGRIEQLNPLEKWQVNNPIISLSVPIGIDMNGKDFKLDLHEKKEGPHGLIAGMTGSGKSEFIITYILSMAINFHPLEVQFVLIDYKGGGLVGAFENKETGLRLPHLAGTITNLETADINRALASIESELKRRQALFNGARDKIGEGTIDIYKYQKYYREGLLQTPVSHLFIISDEFAELKSQQPEFMEQLISTARIGRSLGVHLILATQKPSGIVNDQIWSNSKFRVCLKVQEAADSNEVIKRPDAADLKEVGRFYLQVGYNELFSIGQAAWAGEAYIPQDKVIHEQDNTIMFINSIGKSIKTIDFPKQEGLEVKGEQLPSIVKYLADLAQKENIHIRELWLEKLKDVIYLDRLKQKYNFVRTPFKLQAVIGEYDNPKAQEQGLLSLDLAQKGNVVIYSMGEKNTITNAIIYSLITSYTTQELNIYIMDFDSETLKIYNKAPQVGDVIFAQEQEKVDKLLKMLIDEIESRKKLFQDYNGSYDFYIKQSKTKLPGIVLLLSGYENFKENYEEKDTLLSKIVRDGHKYGIYSVVTAITDRALRLSMRSNFPNIIPLKLSAPIEYNMLLGKKAPMIKESDTRGVALVKEEPYEFQTAMIHEQDKLSAYIKAVCDSLSTSMKEQAPKVPVLPEIVTLEYLQNNTQVSEVNIPVGIEEESLDIATFNFKENLITLVNSDEIEMLSTFNKLLIKEIETIKGERVLLLDIKKWYQPTDFKNTIYLDEQNDIQKELNHYIKEITQKENLLVVINGVDKWIKNMKVEEKSNLATFFTEVSSLNNCNFIFLDRLTEIKPYAYESWFRSFVSVESGIWLGRGIDNSTIHNLITPLRTLRTPLSPQFGYVMKRGNAIRVKFMEKEAEDGK